MGRHYGVSRWQRHGAAVTVANMMDLDQARRFVEFITERERIRVSREDGEPWPWTSDPILQRYSFTNVKREHDRTTQWIWKWQDNWLTTAPRDYLLAMAMATFGRYYGHEWITEVPAGMPVDVYITRIEVAAKGRRAAGQPTYTGAYMITTASRRMDKIEHISLVARDLVAIAPQMYVAWQEFGSWEALMADMTTVPCVGDFMAKEISLDLMRSIPWRRIGKPDHPDVTHWTPFGPGGIRGIRRVFPGIKPDQYLDAARVLRAYCVTNGSLILPTLTAHDVQFQLCEFDKYERARLGEGRLKRLYHRRSV